MNIQLEVILSISVFLLAVIAIKLYISKRNTEKEMRDLLQRENELKSFRGYKEEVAKIREEFMESLPKGMEEIASLWVDLNVVFDRLEREYELNRYERNRRLRLSHTEKNSYEVRRLKDDVQRNIALKYRLEIAEKKYSMAMGMLKDKHDNDSIDSEWTCYAKAIIKEQEEKEEKIKKLRWEESHYKNRIEELKQEVKKTEYKLENISKSYYGRVVSARAKLNPECSTPQVLEKISYVWANYKFLLWEKAVEDLELKRRPISYETASEFRQRLSKYKNEIYTKYKEWQYKYNYLLNLFPELQEYIDGSAIKEGGQEFSEEYEDKRIAYLSKEEWLRLSETEKSQRALDKYNEERKRTNAQVGRDYEEYVGYLFRQRCRGAEIAMYGEQKGLADLGRDLIVKHKEKVYIVQCKRWSKEKVIREKHIMQLFGSTIEYCWETRKANIHPLDVIGKSVIPVFVTTTLLSETARRFAERLGVIVHQVPMGDYPQIKCNIGKEGERIYHLPFDQQYNTTIIEHHKGEFMAWTVKEAEEKGFRRAMRHFLNN